MLGLDQAGVEKLLLQLEEGEYIDPRYQFVKKNNRLSLLGTGGFSYVYEMYDSLMLDKKYAAKVIGLGTKPVDERLILETTQIQYFLGEQSENIMRVIALWTMKIHLDEAGNVTGITGVNEERYEEADGVLLEIVLMERLDNILEKDKYGNIELLRDELRIEEGVIHFAENIGRALFTVHNNGFLHRDIKLENIFWDDDLEQYKLGDFGIARYVGEDGAETVVFTDGYGAPEIERQLVESYNLTADIYSFGITLFLLLNDLKFPASDGYRANIIQYSKDFVIPAPINASEKMAKILRKMCSYRVEDRYQSVEEVLIDIGRIDGSYTEHGFTEYEDLATETYREVEEAQTETFHESVEEDENEKVDNSNMDIPWWEKEDHELNREERKKKSQAINENYSSSSVWRLGLIAVLTVLLFKSFSSDVTYLTRWEFWILPIALFVESILQRLKEFHAEFGFITIWIAVFSMYYLGIDVPQIVAIISVLLGIPAVTAGVSIGTGLWMAQMLTGKLMWLNIFSKWDLGWIVLILFAAAIESYILFRADYKKANDYETFIVTWIMDKIWYLMIIAGVVLIVLARFNVIVIPEIVEHIHLVRTGVGVCVVEVFYLWYYGLLNDEDEVDESLDE